MSLKILDYSVQIKELQKEILNNVSFEMKPGEVVVLVGENGSGKSSLSLSLVGFPGYEKSGKALVDGVNITDLEIDEIARSGLFVSFQSPPEIEGVSLYDFIISGYKALNPDSALSSFKLRKLIIETAKQVGLNETFLERSTNQGFSGGERRKSEVLQMLILNPKVAILDEVDSGLDIKSTNNIAKIIRNRAKENGISIIVISHSPEFIKKLNPDKIVELRNKKLVEVSINDLDEIIEEEQVNA